MSGFDIDTMLAVCYTDQTCRTGGSRDQAAPAHNLMSFLEIIRLLVTFNFSSSVHTQREMYDGGRSPGDCA